MTIPQEILMAYVDGELLVEEMHRVDAELARNPELRSYVDRQMALRGALRKAFTTVLDEPLPERLTAAVVKPASLRWRLREAIRGFAARRFVVQSGIPVAAALACGLVIGVLLTRPDGANIGSADGNLVAKGALAEALSQQLASQSVASAHAKVFVSFRDKSGHYCRTFEAGSESGVACHESGNWQIAALARFEGEAGSASAYQPAASAMPDFVRKAVADMISGAPLDAAAEREARDRGWN